MKRWLKQAASMFSGLARAGWEAFDISYLALLVASIAAVLALNDDYDEAWVDGASRVCHQLTAGAGELHDGVCQVEVKEGVWRTPSVEIRKREPTNP